MSAYLKVELAMVVSVDDPDNLGRVQVQYVDGLLSDWLPVASPFAGPGYGMFALQTTTAPKQSDPAAPDATAGSSDAEAPPASESPSTLALVTFATDDRTYGYVLGFLFRWDDNASPYVIDKEKRQSVWIVKSKSGKTITLDDSEDSPAVTIADEKNNVIKVDTEKNEISIDSQGDFSIKSANNISIVSTGEGTTLTLQAENIALKAQQNVTIEAGAKIDLKGPGA